MDMRARLWALCLAFFTLVSFGCSGGDDSTSPTDAAVDVVAADATPHVDAGDAASHADGASDAATDARDAAPATHTIGGTITGLTGSGLTLANGGDLLAVTANGTFTFATKVATGSAYAVTIGTAPTNPSQTCVVANGAGTVGSSDVTNIAVTCTTATFKIGGTLSGLVVGDGGAQSVTLQNDGGDDLTIGANGAFVFATRVPSGGNYAVTVKTQPSSPAQTCTVSGGSGKVGSGDVGSVVVNCASNTYTVGGSISGLTGTVVLQNQGGDNLSLTANGTFAFATPIASGASYAVTVLTQPATPSQTCVVSNGTGVVGAANVTSVSIVCTTNKFTVGGTLSGLAPGDTVVLQNRGGDNLALTANGVFAFATGLASGSTYAVTVLTQPSAPAQVCTVASGSGSLVAANVTSVAITCTTRKFKVGGTLSGLAQGDSLVLQDDAGDDLALSANGAFTFATTVASGSAYAVTVKTQPGQPVQTCTVTGGSGTIGAGDVTSISVNCDTNSFAIGGTISGLAGTVVLQDDAGDDLTVSTNGSFAFATPIASGGTYAVTVLTNPASPVAQSCQVTLGSGTVGSAAITNVSVQCTTNTYRVGGTISGLAANDTVVVQNDGGDTLPITSNGKFVFATAVSSGAPFLVTVSSQPASPIAQTCVVAGGAGTVANVDVTAVTITCTTSQFTVGGTLSGLGAGDTITLQNEGGDSISVQANGAFTFPTAIASGQPYAVTVLANPSSPIAQTCIVSGGTGTVGSGNVTGVQVNCSTSSFAVGGTISGLNGTVVLRDNGGDDLTLTGNGSFAFPTSVASGGAYAVTVFTNPASPVVQTCSVSQGSGTVGGSAVGSVQVTCITTTFTVGGTIAGLAAGESVSLQDDGGDTITLSANGSFVFPTAIQSGASYLVTVSSQPSTPVQTCTVSSGSGTVTSAAVTSVSITCVGFGSTCPAGTVYTDPFNSNPAARWNNLVGTWTWDSTNSRYATTQGSPHDITWIGARPSWSNYTIDVPIRIDTNNGGNGGIVFRVVNTGTTPPPNDAGQMYYVGILTNAFVAGRENNGWTQYTSIAGTFNVGTFYNLHVVVNGATFTVSINGTSYGSYDASQYPSGSIGLRTWTQGMTYGAVQVTCN